MESEIYIDTAEVPAAIQDTAVFRTALGEMRSVLSEPSTVMAFLHSRGGPLLVFPENGCSC